jgi:hypothetical protein
MDLDVGTTACLRDEHHGQVVWAWPVTVERAIDRGEEHLVVSQLAGATGMVPEGYPDDLPRVLDQAATRQWNLVPHVWTFTHCLHVVQLGQWWGARLMWTETGDFLCWYVDFRTPVSVSKRLRCITTRDLQLDIVVTPDGSWSWKDEDHLEIAYDMGVVTRTERQSVEEARDEVIAAIEAKIFPFDGSYVDWKPSSGPPPLVQSWRTL